MKQLRVSIDRDDFQALVNGGVVMIETPEGVVKIVLNEIGFDVMEECINFARSL